MPKVSVVIPVWGAEKYIERCARSLFEQTLDDMEYIFIDDCTTDRSIEVLRQILEDYPLRKSQTHIIRLDKNSGQSVGRALGMKTATGEFVISCDSDDWVELNMYEMMYQEAKTHNVDLVTCDVMFHYSDKRLVSWSHDDYEKPRDMFTCGKMITLWSMCDKLIRTSIVQSKQIYAIPGVNMWEDVLTSMLVVFYAANLRQIHQTFYHYDVTRNNTTSTSPFTVRKVNDMKICMDEVFKIFKAEDFDMGYTALCYKQCVKDCMLHVHPQNLRAWRNIYPEVHGFVLKYDREHTIKYRLAYWLAGKGVYMPFKKILKRYREKISC